jgi:uncharacterized protein YecT (DUF1311 family)
MMRVVVAAAALALCACTPAPKAQMPGPAQASGIDCAKAQTPVETAICADPERVKLDGEIGAAYSAALARYANAADADAALRAMQGDFNALREAALDPQSVVTLDERMDAQRLWLGALQPPREGFLGDWGSLTGEVTITENPDKTLSLRANAAEPLRGAWVCDLQGTLAKDGDGLKLMSVAAGGSELDGWSVRIVRDGALLKIVETPPAAKPGADPVVRPYCGMNGDFGGAFLPTDKALYQLP